MPWNPNQLPSEILAVHAALVPNGSQGEVVLFGGDEHWSAQQESSGNNSWKKTRVYDVATHSLVPGQVQSPDSDVFCAHHVFTGDGRLLIAGGTSEWPIGGDGHEHDLAFLGHSRCWLYNHAQRRWIETTRLNRNPDQPDEPRSGGRWYPGLVAMGDGSAVAMFGHLDRNDFRHRNTLPERFFPSSQQWVNLPTVMAKSGHPNEGGRRFLFFPRAYVLPNGKVFSSTPLPTEFTAQAGNSDGAHYSTAFDVTTAQYVTPRAASPDGVHANWSYPGVLMPLLPRDLQYNARCLYWNEEVPRWIDTDAPSPTWVNAGTRDASLATRRRINGNAVLLPTAQVCFVGGVHVENPQDPILQAEIYTPDINWSTNEYGNGGGTWQVDSSNAINVRNYHSTALLLPNGKVWVAGGNINGQSGNPDVVGIKQIELYEPSYIAIPDRIEIETAPRLLSYGEEFDVQIDRNATNVARAAIIRNSSVTHSSDNDQRYVGLEVVSRSGNTIRLRMPSNGNVAPPAYYMLWVIDTIGNPCNLARFVRVARLSCRVIADRSTFSEEEVQALGGGTNARFSNALYIDFDGFIDTELSGVPTYTIEFGGSMVPANQVRLQFTRRYTEANPPQPEVPTRITYVFDVIFETMGAFTGWLDRRDLLVRFSLGSHNCIGVIELSKSPNPYMIDINPVTQNPSWLSTDVRVFKVRLGQSRLGIRLDSSATAPWDFIRAAIDRLRSGAESFDSLPVEGSDATLDGAYMSGFPLLPSFNFAIARVRYRATTTAAQNVRCFLRMCNVAATGLEFDQNTVYRRTSGSSPVPLLGVSGGEIISIPFFNAQRIETISGRAGAAGMGAQILDPNYDIQTINPNASGAEVTAYFGCYLDINLPTKRFPLIPGGNGPFSESESLPIRDLLRSWHNCLVAEVYFDGDPTRFGAGPSNSDNLAQRNLAIVGLENPGLKDSRTAMHTFEIAPSRINSNDPILLSELGGNTFAVAGNKRISPPDELFFDWHNLPHDSQVTLYFSDISTADIQMLLRMRVSGSAFTVLDEKTIRFAVGDCAWMPIPGGREKRIPALISIALPEGIVEGEVYRVSIRQVSGLTNQIIGSITIEMPVSKAVFLLPEAERQLSFMGHIATLLSPTDRWYPLYARLIPHLAARVDALGGNSRSIEPNPDGTGKPYTPIQWEPGDPFPTGGFGSKPLDDCDSGDTFNQDCRPEIGWIVSACIAISLTALGLFPVSVALILLAVAIVLSVGLIRYWIQQCHARIACRVLTSILLGSVVALGMLGLGLALFGMTVRPEAIVISSIIALVSVIMSYLPQYKC